MLPELRALAAGKAVPIPTRWNANIALIRRFRVLVRHLEKDQIGELFEIIAIANPVVLQRVAKIPDPGDDGRGVQTQNLFRLFSVAQDSPAGVRR